MAKISVIIPVYNADQYLAKCLDSVLEQSIKDMEIICIDDGSTDGSLNILEDYRRTDSRVTVIMQTNLGAGAARNKGIENAGGEYVAFLDADDYYVDRDALEKMYILCGEKGVDICGSLSKMIQPDENVKDYCLYNEVLQPGQVYVYRDYQFDHGYYCFIYRRELLVRHNIMFPLYRRDQDPMFLARSFFHAGKFTIANTYLYCYRAPNAVFRFNYEKTVDMVNAVRDVMAFAYEKGLDRLLRRKINRLNYDYCGIICHNIKEKDTRLLALLVQTDRWIKENTEEQETIRPLQKILSNTVAANVGYGEAICQWVMRQKRIVLYGAGGIAGQFLNFLRKKGILQQVQLVIVTQKGDGQERKMGIPIVCFSEYMDGLRSQEDSILIAVGPDYQKDILLLLERNGMHYCEIVDDVFVRELSAGGI